MEKIAFRRISKVDHPLVVFLQREFVKRTVTLLLIRTVALDAIALYKLANSFVENPFFGLESERQESRKGEAQR